MSEEPAVASWQEVQERRRIGGARPYHVRDEYPSVRAYLDEKFEEMRSSPKNIDVQIGYSQLKRRG